MGFLSAFLPGMRDFRTPFAAGSLWVAAAMLIVWNVRHGDVASIGLVGNISDVLSILPEPARVAVLVSTVYLVGTIAISVGDWFAAFKMRRMLPGFYSRISRNLVDLRIIPVSRTNSYIADAARERFADYPYAVRTAARSVLEEEYNLADVILASRSPEQYQEYDRRKSEAELRSAIWFPLFLVFCAVSSMADGPASWAILVSGLAASAILKFQAIGKRRQADERLASAVYFELASTPLFDALLREMVRNEERARATGAATGQNTAAPSQHTPPATDAERVMWALRFFCARGIYRSASSLLSHIGGRSEIRKVFEEVDFDFFDKILEMKDVRRFAIVAYGGMEANELDSSIADGLDVDELIGAYFRLHEHLVWVCDETPIESYEIAENGALTLVEDKYVSRVQGSATNDEWKIAVRIYNSRSSRFARYPESALVPD